MILDIKNPEAGSIFIHRNSITYPNLIFFMSTTTELLKCLHVSSGGQDKIIVIKDHLHDGLYKRYEAIK